MQNIDNATRGWRAWLAALCVTILTACGGSDDAPPPPPLPAVGSATIGAAGGVVDGPDGVQLVVPAGALDADVTIRISRNATGAPALPADVPAGIAIYEITPHDLRFGQPVAVRLPLTGTARADGVALVASPGGNWQFVPSTAANGYVEIRRTSLSWYGHLWGASFGCAASSADPFPCVRPVVGPGGETTTNPPGAITRIDVGNRVVQDGITQAATLTVPVAVAAARDCTNARVTVTREIWNTFPPRAPAQQILQQQLSLLPSPTNSSVSTASFTVQTSVTAADNGAISLQFYFECTRAHQNSMQFAQAGLDYLIRITPPTAVPTITQQPVNIGVVEAQPASFSVAASITPAETLSYQWSRRPDTSAAFAPITGATAATLILATTALTDSGAQFQVVVCAAPTRCATSSPATLTVNPVLPAQTAPAFTTQPASVTVTAPAAASFSVAVSGNPPPTLQWQVSSDAGATWINVATVTAATLTVNPTSVGQSNNRYRAVATNSAGSLNSNPATLTVNAAAPAVPWQADTRIAGGGTHSLVVRANGELWSWGTNNGGALGRANASTVTAPSAVTTLGNNLRSVAAGAWYSVALRNDGTVWAWGDGDRVGAAVGSSGAIQLPLQVNGLSTIRAISTRYGHTLALREDGTVWGFGPENFSALGPLVGNNAARQVPGLADVRQVAAGEQHSMALLADGTVRTWGSNTLAQLGLNTSFAPRTAPQTVPITEVVAIAATSFASFALRNDGTLWRWGTLAGSNISAPTQVVVSGTSPITKMVPGNYTLHLLRSDNTLFGFGDNSSGRVGTGVTGGTVAAPSQIGVIGNVADVGGGEFHTMAVRDDGRVFSWGSNSSRQLSGMVGADANVPQDSGFTR